MGMGKWIGGVVGWMAGGPLGALAGYVLGSLFDTVGSATATSYDEGSNDDPLRRAYQKQAYDEGQRNSFLFSLLALASYVISADGRIMHSEMEYVRNFLRASFGEVAVGQGEQILRNLFERKKQMDSRSPQAFKNTMHDCAAQIAANTTYEQRLQLLNFLIGISKADGRVSPEEVEALKDLARFMRIPEQEIDSLLNLGSTSVVDAYKVLEIAPTATNDEVKSAYRRQALKHHPDKVASLGEDVQRAAEEKFKNITQAYDLIRKERGMR